jgi:hypothetical protein
MENNCADCVLRYNGVNELKYLNMNTVDLMFGDEEFEANVLEMSSNLTIVDSGLTDTLTLARFLLTLERTSQVGDADKVQAFILTAIDYYKKRGLSCLPVLEGLYMDIVKGLLD